MKDKEKGKEKNIKMREEERNRKELMQKEEAKKGGEKKLRIKVN